MKSIPTTKALELRYKESTELTNIHLENFLKKNVKRDLYKQSIYALFEGKPKRIRPLMVMLSAMAVGGKKNNVKDAMIGIELFHSATLVHDDIIDESELRRGNATICRKFGIPSAIILGDFLLMYASVLLCSDSNLERKKAFQKVVFDICEGQLNDSLYETMDANIKIYFDIAYQKTGSLCEYACFLGSHVSGGKKQEVQALSLYGKYIGIAFQIQNDLNNIFSNTKNFLPEDVVSGKKTYVTVKALELDRDTTNRFLKKISRSNKVHKKDIKEFQDFLIKLGVVEAAQRDIKKYCEAAIRGIQGLKHTQTKEFLRILPKLLFGERF